MIDSYIRPFVFISYSRDDGEFVARLKTDLQTQGINIWIDREGIQPGTPNWEEALRTAIRAAHAVLLIASPHSRSSRYVNDELRISEMYQRPVYPIWITGTQWMEAIPIGWGGTQYIDAREARYSKALPEIIMALRVSSSSVPLTPSKAHVQDFEPRNPYKGLRAFSGKDSRDFFGRDTLIDELASALEETLAVEKNSNLSARLLAVVGPSGSGKSSVVMAGLLPCLQDGGVLDSKEWIYLDPIVPGRHPVESLALTLWEKMSNKSLKAIREDLEDESVRGLHLLTSSLAKQQGTKVVLFVDQFEELFTQTVSEEERRRFIDLLVAAITEPHGPIIVILTLRADFYDRPMQYPQLGKLIEERDKSVFPMETNDLRAVIEKPAELPDVQLAFEGDLVGDLLFEVRGETGALPLLQFTLDQLFQRRSGHLLTLQAYREIGGIKGALAKHAESTYASLPSEEHRALARVLFLRLIDPGRTEQDTTRRRAPLMELSLPDPIQTKLLRETADAFIEARLLTANIIVGVPTVEVSHEALIQEWTRLAGWLRTDRNDILLQQAISEDAREWKGSEGSIDRLYRGTQLMEAQAWAARNKPIIDEIAFLEAGMAEQERREKEERERVARELALQRRAARRQRYVIGMMGVTSVVIVVGLIVTLVLQNNLLVAQKNLLASLPVAVTNLKDNGPGSLREAIATASPNSTITFAKYLKGTLTLTSGELVINKNLTIGGPGASVLSISGGKDSRVFHVKDNVTVTISNLTIENGKADYGAGIDNIGTLNLLKSIVSGNTAIGTNCSGNDTCNGGGIGNGGTLIVTNSTVFGNKSDFGGGVANVGTVYFSDSTVSGNIANVVGGGIYNDGIMTLHNSTISDNTSSMLGGGLYNGQILTITNSTISANKADADGGGIYNEGPSNPFSAATLSLTNSTISSNTAKDKGGGIDSPGETSITYCTVYRNAARSGGGISIRGSGTLAVKTSIIAGDNASSSPDVFGLVTLLYPNLIQNISGAEIVFGSDPHDPTINSLTKKSIFGKSPNLGPLQDNGGPTQTHALLPDSPAIDQIPLLSTPGASGSLCGFNGLDIFIDQRNAERPQHQGNGCDLGAYEYS